MKTVFTILICVGLLGGAAFAVKTLAFFKPEAKKVEKERIVPAVEIMEAKPVDVALKIPTQGLIEASRTTSIASEVAGKVIRVDERFEIGGIFQEGEVMIELDAADYQAALTQSEATAADARAALAQEKARAEQAIRDWKKIAPGTEPTKLAVREPQLKSAEARVKAAENAVTKSQRDLERTKIKAPFNARVKATRTELGSYLTPGAPVVDLDSTGKFEVRLPLSLDDFAFIKTNPKDGPSNVTLTARIGPREIQWEGQIVRIEGEVDRASRSVRIVAEVSPNPQIRLLQPGLFVKASVEGQTLKNVFRIPRSAFVDEDTVLVVKEDGRITFRDLRILRPDGTDLLVEAGLKAGENVCLTTLAAPIEDMEVQILASGPGASTTP